MMTDIFDSNYYTHKRNIENDNKLSKKDIIGLSLFIIFIFILIPFLIIYDFLFIDQNHALFIGVLYAIVVIVMLLILRD